MEQIRFDIQLAIKAAALGLYAYSRPVYLPSFEPRFK